MPRFRASSFVSRALLTMALTLALAAVAAASIQSGSYHGSTKQGKGISFSVSNGAVSNIAFTINDTCPDGHILRVTIAKTFFPPLTIGSKGRFRGTEHAPHQTNQPTAIRGALSGKKASGAVSDITLSSKEHKLCHGHTGFSASTK